MKTIIFFTLLMVVGNLTYGQESKKYLKLKQNYNYREGYIINSDSLKVKGLIRDYLMNEAKKYSVVTFVQIDGTKKKYYPSGIKGYGYSIYKFVSDNSSFYEIVQNGKKVSLYKNLSVSSWSAHGAPGMPPITHSSSSEDFYVKRANDTTFKLVGKKKFKEEFSRYFEDCDEIETSILNEKLTHKDIKSIVRRYNYCK